jgi:hypothetical protein
VSEIETRFAQALRPESGSQILSQQQWEGKLKESQNVFGSEIAPKTRLRWNGVNPEILPPLPPQSEKDRRDGSVAIAKDLLKGAVDEVVQHPDRLAESAVIGAALTVVAWEIAIPVGIAFVSYQLYENGNTAIDDLTVVGDPRGHSKAELNNAHSGVQILGAGGADLAAGMAGGLSVGTLGRADVAARLTGKVIVRNATSRGAAVLEEAIQALQTNDPDLIIIDAKSGEVLSSKAPSTADTQSSNPDLTTPGAKKPNDSSDAPIEPVASAARTPEIESQTVGPTGSRGKGDVGESSPVDGNLENADARELPAGSIERLNDRLDKELGYRNLDFDVPEAEAKMAQMGESEGTLVDDFLHAAHDLYFHRDDIYDSEYMRQTVNGHPEASHKYELLYQHFSARKSLSTQIKQELEERAKLVAEIVNEEAGSLFPQAAMPKIKIELEDYNSDAEAWFQLGSGDLGLQARFMTPSVVDGTKQLTSRILHEMKHAEQAELIIRKYIDEVVPAESQEKSLTANQFTQISELFYNDKLGNGVEPEVLFRIFAHRAGQRLTPDQLRRAAGLVDSFKDWKETSTPSSVLQVRVIMVENALNSLESSRLYLYYLDSQDQTAARHLAELFDGNVPMNIKDFIERASRTGGRKDLPIDDDAEFRSLLTEELNKQLVKNRGQVHAEYDRYLGRTHEAEAEAVMTEAIARLKPGAIKEPGFIAFEHQ